jgi:DNA polymerase-1
MIDKLLEWRGLHEAPLDVRRGPADADRQPMAGSTRRSTRPSPRPAGLSSSDPNLQNIPIRTELGRRIRRAFVAGAPSSTLLAADYSQIELRILAHVSGDEHLKDAFARNADIHRETAARVLDKPRRTSPTQSGRWPRWSTSGSPTGMSDFGSRRGPTSGQEAQAFINSYFARTSGSATT